jgi:hypothetical protein
MGLQAQSTKLVADAPRAVLEGEKFQLVYSLNAEGSDLRLPQMDNFQILMGPSTSQSTSMTIINGNMERTTQYVFTYILKANNVGKYTINPATIMVKGNKIESNPIQIEVIKSDDPKAATRQSSGDDPAAASVSGDDLFIVNTVNKKEVYKDEPIVMATKIYVRSLNLEGISDIKAPPLQDFISQELPQKANLEWSVETLNGKTYNVATYQQKLLFPQKAGNITIPATEIEFLVKQRTARRSSSPFDDFFESNYRTIKKRVATKPITVLVKALPAGAPADFAGIVGTFKMEVTTSKNKVAANDGVTLKINISGTGNHKLMNNPKLNVPTDFDQFDPKVTNDISNTSVGMTGTKTFEYLIIPRHAGNFTIPAVTLSYFDITTRSYKQLTSAPITLQVERGSQSDIAATTTPYSANREEVKFLGKDIRYIKTDSTPLKPRGTFLYGSMLYVLLFILPALILLVFIVLAQKHIKENANLQLVRNKRANKVAIKRLKKASHLLKQGNKEAFYDEVLRALWGYLSDKLSLPMARLSKENASTVLEEYQVPQTTIQSFMQILDTCEFARYAPGSGSEEMDKLYAETIETITLLENQVRK